MTRKLKRYFLIFSIFAFAIVAAVGLSKMKPPPETREATDPAILVDVLSLETVTANFTIESQGTVRPRTETILSAEIAGTVIRISPKFIAGGVFSANEELLKIDPTNYVVIVDQAEALVDQRQIEYDGALKLREQGYRAEAELAAAAAALAGAKAASIRARKDVERTSIRVPYAGMVRAKEVDLGRYLSPGTRLGVVFATDYAEVRLPLTDSDLAFVNLPGAMDIAESGDATNGPQVRFSAIQRGRPASWDGRIVRTEGVVDERNRVTFAVARIVDPYRMHQQDNAGTPLPMGTFVKAKITGLVVDDLIRVPRSALRGNNQLMFVDDENRLRIRVVDVMRADAEFAYIGTGVEAGERISITAIEAPINGMLVKTEADSANDDRLAAESGDAGSD
jgi:RND family efflux transporter MFP subunit